ncbi:MAG: DEAD/DEAH box helicase [Oscillospiraceae bacterium]
MRTPLAHSARKNYPPQTYEAHVRGVCERAGKYAAEAECYSVKANGILSTIVRDSALLHDLGKLEERNQSVLCEQSRRRRHLPVDHTDAGSAALQKMGSGCAAMLVYSHHQGLPDLSTEFAARGCSIFRNGNAEVRAETDAALPALLRQHEALFPRKPNKEVQAYDGDPAVFLRMALSCLADADHGDTAAAFGQTEKAMPELRPQERLAALDHYVSKFGETDERSSLRRELYQSCRSVEAHSGFSVCGSPVGSGKTTAVMAHLLEQACKRNARRIFVVLPYTSIIRQSVDIYRKALVLPGETPEDVVAELHSRADFEDIETRYLTALWRAPIVVTTAVAFFETLSSHNPAALRRLHELPGSLIFVDEAHSALPLRLLPLAWHWMNVLSDEWSCYWVLASGSLVRYWELQPLSGLSMPRPEIAELVRPDLQRELSRYESSRITFRWREKPIGRKELAEWVQEAPGPRLLILNTVQSAAVIAADMAAEFGQTHVEHLSTALTPEDRGNTIDRIRRRLADPDDADWTLVATSCVEAGVDFSFRTGFREISSLLSLLQAAGRVNRHGRNTEAVMWSFPLQDDSMLPKNPALDVSAAVLRSYFQKRLPITPELSTRSMQDELVRDDSCMSAICDFAELEAAQQFRTLAQKFRVIDQKTVLAVPDDSMASAIAEGRASWQELQRHAVSVRKEKIVLWHLREIADGIYQWTLGYDSFLGYMHGVLLTE